MFSKKAAIVPAPIHGDTRDLPSPVGFFVAVSHFDMPSIMVSTLLAQFPFECLLKVVERGQDATFPAIH